MLIPNNPDLDFAELNRRIANTVAEYKLSERFSLPEQQRKVYAEQRSAEELRKDLTLDELLSLEDREFIEQSYCQILGRKAEGGEHNPHLLNLRKGMEKTRILVSMRYSREGRQRKNHLLNFRKYLLFHLLKTIPPFGFLIHHGLAVFRYARRQRFINARFNKLHQQLQASNAQLASVTAELHRQQRYLRKELLTEQQVTADALRAYIDTKTGLLVQELTGSGAIDDEDASLYKKFEDRFRGERSTILARLAYYQPFVQRCAALQEGACFVDLGCGRGEWLELLSSWTVTHLGIDLDEVNVTQCNEYQLNAEQGDAIGWLTLQKDDSLGGISCFHVIEHLPFSHLNKLIELAHRKLKSGGLLIFETPNPENLLISSIQFHMDPTHLKPLPADLVRFMVEHHGFQDTEVHPLHAFPEDLFFHEDTEVARRLNHYFYGPQDYAVVAFK